MPRDQRTRRAMRTVSVAPTTFGIVVTTEHSHAIYRQMAEVVRRLVHDTSHVHLDGLGHAAAQVGPDRVAGEVLQFWRPR